MSKKVYIGVGHGGKDPGAVANGFKESDLNLSIALACNDVLVRHGVSTMISRTKDEDDSLSERIKDCNAFNPDCAVEIHNNAGGGDGAEVYHAKENSYDDTLAKNILDAIVAIGQNSRGLKTKTIPSTGGDYFGFVREIKAPSVLVECAFVDNKTDLAIIDTAEEQKTMGVAIAKGILKTLGIAYKEENESAPISGNFNVGDIVQFGGGKHYTSANGSTGYNVKAGHAKITRISNGSKHPYHVVHTDNSSSVYGWVDAASIGAESTITTTVVDKTIKNGDIVSFAGGKHYISANGNVGFNASAGEAKITNIKEGAKHPYHAVRVSGGGSNVYGWVDANTVTK